MDTLKALEPNATPDGWRAFSDTCLDIAAEALGMALVLEAGKRPAQARYETLVALVNRLPEVAPGKSDGDATNG